MGIFTPILHKNVILDLDIENFENIYNALYCDSEDEESENSDNDEEEDLYEDQEKTLEDSDDLNLDNYGDENSSGDESVDMEEKKKTKNIKKKKVIKIQETRDILYEETTPQEKLDNETRAKVLDLFLKLNEKKEIDDYFFKEMEMEIFNYAIKSSIQKNIVPTWNILLKKIYINKARSLYNNLTPNSYVKNTKLYDRMRKKEFTANELVNLTIQELSQDEATY